MVTLFGREFVQNGQEKSLKTDVFRQIVVEHRRFELLTPTLPVLCATNCANAPSTATSISCQFQLVKYEGRFLKKECCRDVVGRENVRVTEI